MTSTTAIDMGSRSLRDQYPPLVSCSLKQTVEKLPSLLPKTCIQGTPQLFHKQCINELMQQIINLLITVLFCRILLPGKWKSCRQPAAMQYLLIPWCQIQELNLTQTYIYQQGRLIPVSHSLFPAWSVKLALEIIKTLVSHRCFSWVSLHGTRMGLRAHYQVQAGTVQLCGIRRKRKLASMSKFVEL